MNKISENRDGSTKQYTNKGSRDIEIHVTSLPFFNSVISSRDVRCTLP